MRKPTNSEFDHLGREPGQMYLRLQTALSKYPRAIKMVDPEFW
jgi:hypothetical protein